MLFDFRLLERYTTSYSEKNLLSCIITDKRELPEREGPVSQSKCVRLEIVIYRFQISHRAEFSLGFSDIFANYFEIYPCF